MKIDISNYENAKLYKSLMENFNTINQLIGMDSDKVLDDFIVAGIRVGILSCEGLTSTSDMSELILKPMRNFNPEKKISSNELLEVFNKSLLIYVSKVDVETYGQLMLLYMSGFAIVMVDGVDKAIAIGVQSYAKRGVSEPSGEINLRGSHEGFVEPIRSNLSMMRRRIKSPTLIFDMFQLGTKSKTDVCIVYLSDKASQELVKSVKQKLQSVQLETVLESGYLQPFLEGNSKSIFYNIYTTERPDIACAKILEGRVIVVVDGTPFTLICPYLFVENFQTLDDYCAKSYFVTFARWLKYISFIISVFLPGVYVAVACFHPELINSSLLLNLAEEEENVPFPLVVEAITVLIFYEILKESALRLPKAIGGAVSLVGGLIIGDAAVTSGLISTPLLIVTAVAVTASYVIPSLDQSSTILRMIFVIAGGIAGLYGIALLSGFVIINVCSMESYGIPATAPLSPFTRKSMSDIITRIGFKKLQNRNIKIDDLNGVKKDVKE